MEAVFLDQEILAGDWLCVLKKKGMPAGLKEFPAARKKFKKLCTAEGGCATRRHARKTKGIRRCARNRSTEGFLVALGTKQKQQKARAHCARAWLFAPKTASPHYCFGGLTGEEFGVAVWSCTAG